MSHQYQATIDLIKSVIDSAPVFPVLRRNAMQAAIGEWEKNDQLALVQVEDKAIEFGKEIWPYKEAYEAFYKIYGEAKEHMLMREKMSEAAREALDKFVKEGGNIESVKDGVKFEHFFNSDIRAEIVNAELDAHDGVRGEMEALIGGEKKSDFEALLLKYREQLEAIAAKISEFKILAVRSEKWQAEIQDKVRTFELGLALLEPTPSLDDVKSEIQYYIDIMEV